MATTAKELYLKLISGRLIQYAVSAKSHSMLNLTDSAVIGENVFCGLLNMVFGWKLHNANMDKKNISGIDLVDETNKILVQVSVTTTKEKIHDSLRKIPMSYSGYRFIFVPISTEFTIINDLRRYKKYEVRDDVAFNPANDIYDIKTILAHILHDDIDIERISEYVLKNIKVDYRGLDSGLEYVITQLSNTTLEDDSEIDTVKFDIDEKITYNNLVRAKYIIEDYKVNYFKVNSIYDEYSRQGNNKTNAVLQKIRKYYIELSGDKDGDGLFFEISNKICEDINCDNMPDGMTKEELGMYVDILLVHAFIECKIFKKPKN